MRIRARNGEISVHAISGSYVVLLGMDATEEAAKGLLGFAIQRTDHTEHEQYWLKGFKTFEATDPNPPPGSLVSTREHPIQGFLWGDYTSKPDHDYTYEIVPLYGTPKNLTAGMSVSVKVSTENEDVGQHAIFFNRGVAGSQAYARKFQNRPPDKVPKREAFIWLSRGLEEAMLAFIGQAKGNRYGLRAAVYEFSYLPALKALGAAARSGADVKIVYDARRGKGKPVAASDRTIRAAGIRKLMIKRTKNPSYIAHNKFIVLLDGGKPVAVWTGSTNFTEAGIFGQSNVGHIVRDGKVAQAYLDYWNRLAQDPEADGLRLADVKATPDPIGRPESGSITPIFSPRASLAALDWYARQMDEAAQTVCFTAAFGVNDKFAGVLAKDKIYLRYILLETPGKNLNSLTKDRDNQIAIGAIVETDSLHRWLREKLTGLNVHVKYLHTKYLLIDPLGDNPTVITGSANFSDSSTVKNDENMLIIQGNTQVADLYLGEFMRLFHHFAFRDQVKRLEAEPGSKEYNAAYLRPDDSWTLRYYRSESVQEKERTLFR